MTPITYASVLEEVLDSVRGRNNAELKAKIARVINNEYFALYGRYSWEMGRLGPVDYDFTSKDYDDGLWLPSNLAGIDMVWDDSNKIEFIRRTTGEQNINENGYRYNIYRGSRSPLFIGTDGDFSQGSASFSSVSLGAAIPSTVESVNGLFVRLDSELGYYEISSDTTPFNLVEAYRYESKTAERFIVRPEETQKIVLVDNEENPLTDRTVQLYYWTFPEPLVNDGDIVMLPSAEALTLKVISKLPEAKPHRPLNQNQVDIALDDAIRLNSDFPRNKALQTTGGRKVGWGDQFYSRRESGSSNLSRTIKWR